MSELQSGMGIVEPALDICGKETQIPLPQNPRRSAKCFRRVHSPDNEDVIGLYNRRPVGTDVVVLQSNDNSQVSN